MYCFDKYPSIYEKRSSGCLVVGERRHVFRTIICDTWHQIGLIYCICSCIYRHTYMYTNTRMSAIIFAIVTIKIRSKRPFVNIRDNLIWYYHRAFPYFVGFHLNDMLLLVMKQCERCSVYTQSRYLKADRIVLTILWFQLRHKFIYPTTFFMWYSPQNLLTETRNRKWK